MKAMRNVRWLVLAVASATLAGCLGKTPPVEEYLSVRTATERPCAQTPAANIRQVTVALKPFKALDALDRQAVMTGRGLVMRPSTVWYWEATPARLVDQTLLRGLCCSATVTGVWPVRSTTKTDLLLAGMVNAFWVDTATATFTATVHAQLWDGKQTEVLASKDFTAQAKARSLDAQGIAEAASTALAALSGDVRAWLESQPASGKGLPSAGQERIGKQGTL